jgi:nicotinamidase-related amidase
MLSAMRRSPNGWQTKALTRWFWLGAQTDQCVAATVMGAIQAGFRVTVVSNAHSTWDLGGETAEQIIARYNAAFTDAGVNLVTTQSLTAAVEW